MTTPSATPPRPTPTAEQAAGAPSAQPNLRPVQYVWVAFVGFMLFSYAEAHGERIAAAVDGRGSVGSMLFAARSLFVLMGAIAVAVAGWRLVPELAGDHERSRVKGRSWFDALFRRYEGLVATNEGVAYPVPPTRTVAVWLLAVALLLVATLLALIGNGEPGDQTVLGIACGAQRCNELTVLLAAVISGGLGATITAIAAFLQHASEQRDFREAFAPWYVGRLVTGMLLAVVFYFVLKGGLFATVGMEALKDSSIYPVAAIAALVGMFSKNAVEKLREVFNVLFKSTADIEVEFLARVSPKMRKQFLDAKMKQLLTKITPDEDETPPDTTRGGETAQETGVAGSRAAAEKEIKTGQVGTFWSLALALGLPVATAVLADYLKSMRETEDQQSKG